MSYAVIYKVRRGLREHESATCHVILETRHEAIDFSRSMGKLREWVKVVELTGSPLLDKMLLKKIAERCSEPEHTPQDLGKEALLNRVALLEARLAQCTTSTAS